jgi:hypothetical protein
MNEIFTQALSYVIKALFLALTGVADLLRQEHRRSWLGGQQLYSTVKRYVQAAEKLASTGSSHPAPRRRITLFPF